MNYSLANSEIRNRRAHLVAHCRSIAMSLLVFSLLLSAGLTASAQSFTGPSSAFTDSPSSAEKAQALGPALSTVALTTSMEVLNDSVKLGIGDRVSLRVVEERRVPISLIITDSGEMEVPLIGRVAA